MENSIQYQLEKLDFLSKERDKQRLYWVEEKEKHCDNSYIYLALEKATKYGVDAIYFRIFENQDRPPIPQIYIYDKTNKEIDKHELSEKHRRVWNSVQVPLIYVFTHAEVLIFNSYNQPHFENGRISFDVFEMIKLAADADLGIKNKNEELIKDFSAKSFDNGSFWEKENYRNRFRIKESAYEKLISKLREIREKLLNENILLKKEKLEKDEKKKIIHRLLVMSILLKYLEEKRDERGNTVFPKNFFTKYAKNANTFVDVLENEGDIISLFSDLSTHFNGEIFRLTEEDKKNIQKLNLKKFAEFFEGKTEKNGQRTLWKLYSFNDLPVELISNIYEEFIEDKKDGIVYTPPFLVNFLLNEVVPLTNNNTNFKILDPACGSGIFLAQAYKRLIYRWRAKNKWKHPSKQDLKSLKKLLSDNIYGVDKKEEAIRLTAFSLTLALCDELSPPVIWEELRFDTLKNRNLFQNDFFKLITEKVLPTNLDLIIGNPPFISELTNDAKRISESRKEKNLPDLPPSYSLSFLFLELTTRFIKNDGNICLLFPSDALLHKKSSLEFYNYFFNQFNVKYIVDFTPLRRILFKSATVGTVAIFYNNSETNSESITHIIARRTRSSRNEIFFELDKYDFFTVSKKEALKNNFIWKTNLFGVSTRNYEFIAALNQYPKLKDYMKIKFEKGIISERKTEYPFLMIKKNLGGQLLSTLLVQDRKELANNFRSETFSIYSSTPNIRELNLINNRIKKGKNLYKFFILNTSDRAGLSRSAVTILASDIKNIPFTKQDFLKDVTELQWIIINDTVKYWDNFLRLGENSIILNQPSLSQLKGYAETYLKILNSIYKTYIASDPIQTQNHIIYPFYWGKMPELLFDTDDLEKHLNQILFENSSQLSNLRFVRVMRIYDDNVIYLIKPKQLRYWLRSIAIRDADESFAYLVEQEYHL